MVKVSGSLTISGLSASEPLGQRVFGPATIVGTQVIGETLATPLVSGDNTFPVPTGAVACWIEGPVNGAVTLKLRTNINSGDVGLPINGTGSPTIFPFSSPAPTSLIINASAGQSAFLVIAFI